MNVENLIESAIRHSVVEVFSTMLGGDIEPGEISREHSAPETSEGIVSFIGIAGRWSGTGSISCSSAVACRICSQMLMTEATSLNEEVLDAVAELTNMIIGNVKSTMERHLGDLGLSIPTVVFGKNFKTKTGSSIAWIVEKFQWDGQELIVKMCLAPNDKFCQNASNSLGQTCPVDL
jgi:chemotaxis protein CheX